jgi:Tfp pilus assembly protein PilO
MARRRSQVNVDREWHLDKKVPISLIGTMIVQTCAIVWWVSGMNSDVASMKAHITEIRQENKERTEKLEKFGAVEVEIRNLRQSMDRIEQTLDRMLTVNASRVSEAPARQR